MVELLPYILPILLGESTFFSEVFELQMKHAEAAKLIFSASICLQLSYFFAI